MIAERLPWHEPQWLRIERSIRSGRMPHAILLRGVARQRQGDVRVTSCRRELLCGSNAPPCETCASCRLCAAGSHPDWIEVTLEPDRREIVVEQIRDLVHSVGLTARFGRYKVIIVNPCGSDESTCGQHHPQDAGRASRGDGVRSRVVEFTHNCRRRSAVAARWSTFPSRTLVIATEWLHGRVPEPGAALALAHGAPVRAVEIVEQRL